MAIRKNGTLEEALRQLVQSQAQLVENQARLVAQHTAFVSHLDEDRQRFSRIERDLDLIKALLIKHEELLQKLPDTIKDKIGFKQ
jgi:hypothetical protein